RSMDDAVRAIRGPARAPQAGPGWSRRCGAGDNARFCGRRRRREKGGELPEKVPQKKHQARQAALPQKLLIEYWDPRGRTPMPEELALPTGASLLGWGVYGRRPVPAQRRLPRATGMRGRDLQGRAALLQVC